MKNITIFLAIACVFLIFSIRYSQMELKHTTEQKNQYKENANVLIQEIKDRNKKEMETNIRLREMEEIAKKEKDKSDFDWYYDISNSDVIKFLQAD